MSIQHKTHRTHPCLSCVLRVHRTLPDCTRCGGTGIDPEPDLIDKMIAQIPVPPRWYHSPRGPEEISHYSCPEGNYREAPMAVQGRDDLVAYLCKPITGNILAPDEVRLVKKSDLQVVLVDKENEERRVPFDQWERERKPIT